ncbi:hypothetical protein [Klebsiella michiganensis]|uniref:hypothetical protein n=1 Tax=Klebsiella michiganensis TaxID=1134687 RepID=UPI0007CC25F5|nr:hypothetical protein [Klebsiella michiganensis]SBL45902.1 Eaa1 [Klebsiella michiganensis]DAQ51603.1 MAG TPA: hypothetical protein [Caudoviricetes sp.]
MTNNQLTENSVTQLLNSVKLARDNAERDDNRVDHSFYYALARALEELKEHRKAAMDSEPVAWIVHARTGDQLTTDGGYVANAEGILGLHSTPLYRHAQQPLVPDNRAITQHFDTIALETAREILCDVNRRHEFLGGEVQLLSRIQCRIDAACRAAILQAQSDDDGEPTDDERIMAIEGIHNCERCGDEGWVMGEMGITRCACGQAGNSPVIGIDLASGPDRTVEVRYVAPPGYVMVPKEPTETMINAWLSEVANWRGHVAGYKAMLAVAPQEVK